MLSVLKLSCMKRPGSVVQAKLTSVEIKPNQTRTAYEYAKMYRDTLMSLMPFVRLDMIIDCHGGLTESACGLLDVLEELDRPIRVLIDGRCGSAATLIAFGAVIKDAAITPGSSVYVHMPTIGQYRREGGVWNVIRKLGTMSSYHLFAGTYAARSKQPKALWKKYMQDGTTFKAQEAVDIGLCSRIIPRWEWEKVVIR